VKPKEEEPHKKSISPKEREGFLRMVSMGVCANLYNGSPGRCPKITAKQACDAAEHLWEEWIKRA
jgi:hypothetical protein